MRDDEDLALEMGGIKGVKVDPLRLSLPPEEYLLLVLLRFVMDDEAEERALEI